METIGRLLFYGHSYTKEETKKAAFLPNHTWNAALTAVCAYSFKPHKLF